MTGYNVAHGDTAAVQLDLDNDYGTYKTYQNLISHLAWWDEEGSTWNDVDKAADAVREFVEGIKTGERTPEFGEIFDADLGSVDFREIVTDVLRETNLQEKRDADAGL
ncbi:MULTISPECIES: hypothetical protein [Nocardia]|uniref:hypothetical protein n=1 Tax=Nocardia TaxID=1817 RepID=UPI0007A5299B|nr:MULTISPECIES: hypothetical protein [Nocardia]